MEGVGGVVIHYFSARNVDEENEFNPQACFNLFLDLNRPMEEREFYMKSQPWTESRNYASAHYMIEREGKIWQLVDTDKQAYHAGKSGMSGRENCNRWTLGVELIGHQHSGFTREQYLALTGLLLRLEEDYHFPRSNIQGHDTVRYQAIQWGRAGNNPKYKYDPSGRKDGKGDNFDWFYLGKLMNDIVPNPEGVAGIDDLEAIIDADPNSQN